MRLIIALFACLGFMSAAYADSVSVGVFTLARGPVQLLRGENYLAAAPGVEVRADDIIETGKSASAQVDMEDGSVLKLGPETRISLSDYKLDSNKGVISATLDVLSGWLRFTVAKLKPQGRYSFNTPVLTIGVRGTEGTIEAENEQGGLHLQEGAVDVSPIGPDVPGLQPIRVTSGEFIQRLRGQQLAKLPKPPSTFEKRVPPVMQEKIVPRKQELKERGVPPRVIRSITREDAKRIMDRHPHMQPKLRDRFNKSIGNPNDKGAASEGDKEAAPAAFGGKVLRERQLRNGASGDPGAVSEGLRRRFQQQQEKTGATVQDRGIEPTTTLQRSPTIVPGATVPLDEKSLTDRSITTDRALTDKSTISPTLTAPTTISPTLSPTIRTAPTTLEKPLSTGDTTTDPNKTQTLQPTTKTILQPKTTTIQSR
jgi:hypothetical protein